jgi:magnesium transporter
VLDIFEEEVTEDIQRLGGSEPLDQPYFAVSAFQIVRKRIGWLLLLFVASTLSGEVIRMFQNELDLVVALGFFITLITARAVTPVHKPCRRSSGPSPWTKCA